MYIVKQLFFSMSLNSGRIISENCARIFPSPPFSVFVAFNKGGGGGDRKQVLRCNLTEKKNKSLEDFWVGPPSALTVSQNKIRSPTRLKFHIGSQG